MRGIEKKKPPEPLFCVDHLSVKDQGNGVSEGEDKAHGDGRACGGSDTKKQKGKGKNMCDSVAEKAPRSRCLVRPCPSQLMSQMARDTHRPYPVLDHMAADNICVPLFPEPEPQLVIVREIVPEGAKTPDVPEGLFRDKDRSAEAEGHTFQAPRHEHRWNEVEGYAEGFKGAPDRLRTRYFIKRGDHPRFAAALELRDYTSQIILIDNHVAVAECEHRIDDSPARAWRLSTFWFVPEPPTLHHHTGFAWGRSRSRHGQRDGKVVGVPETKKHFKAGIVLKAEAGQAFGRQGSMPFIGFSTETAGDSALGTGMPLSGPGFLKKSRTHAREKRA